MKQYTIGEHRMKPSRIGPDMRVYLLSMNDRTGLGAYWNYGYAVVVLLSTWLSWELVRD